MIQQNRLTSYQHILSKDKNDWVKNWMDYEVDGVRPRGNQTRPRDRLWNNTAGSNR